MFFLDYYCIFVLDRKNILHSRRSQPCREKGGKGTPKHCGIHRPGHTETDSAGEYTERSWKDM